MARRRRHATIARVGAQLREVPDTDVAVPSLDWTVADLAQHVACLPDFWRRQHAGGSDFDRPDDFAQMSDEARAHITETDPTRLAEMIEVGFQDFVTDLAAAPSERFLYGTRTTTTHMCAMALNELILHGGDLAEVTGPDAPRFTRDEANAAVEAMIVMTPFFVDADKARDQPDGVYHVRFRGGRDFTWKKSGSELTITEGRPERADARLVADPATFLASSLGRIGQVRVALSGKMIAYGRRPWRFIGLGSIAVDGV